MMQCQRKLLSSVIVIGLILWNSDYLVQGESSETEGSCDAYDPQTCEDGAASIEADVDEDDYVDGHENDDYGEVAESDCQDDGPKCREWAELGECENNPRYMLHSCRRSCFQCPDQADELAKILEEKRKKNKNWTDEELKLALDMGKEQHLGNADFSVTVEETAARIIAAREYLNNSGIGEDIMEICKNQHQDCTTWAIAGECEANKKYMATSCAPACLQCDMLLLENRCLIDPNAKPAWEPGSLNAMFERLVSEPISSKYPVTILSRDPWVVTLDDVISEKEAQRLIDLGGLEGYKRSEDVGEKKPDGTYGSVVSTGRTSSNAWCTNDCYNDPMALDLMDRLSELTLINEKNSEFLQLLRYEPGQFYEDHHDYIEHNINNQQGVRILTSYLYLNDVEAGGGTKFTKLNITVMPKRGRALFWPSVRDDKPHKKDHRTNHQALPVEAGIKYGANGWFHQYDFKTPYEEGCSG